MQNFGEKSWRTGVDGLRDEKYDIFSQKLQNSSDNMCEKDIFEQVWSRNRIAWELYDLQAYWVFVPNTFGKRQAF